MFSYNNSRLYLVKQNHFDLIAKCNKPVLCTVYNKDIRLFKKPGIFLVCEIETPLKFTKIN